MKSTYCLDAEMFAVSWLYKALVLKMFDLRPDVFETKVIGEFKVDFPSWSMLDKKTQKAAMGLMGTKDLDKRFYHLYINSRMHLEYVEDSVQLFGLVTETAIHEVCHLIQYQKLLNQKSPLPTVKEWHGEKWMKEMRNLGVHKPSPCTTKHDWWQEGNCVLYIELFSALFDEYKTYREVAYEEFDAIDPEVTVRIK